MTAKLEVETSAYLACRTNDFDPGNSAIQTAQELFLNLTTVPTGSEIPETEIKTPNTKFQPRVMREVKPGRKYGIYQAPERFDPWVMVALKKFDRPLFDSMYYSTRRPAGVKGMYGQLEKFDGPDIKIRQLPRRPRTLLQKAMDITREKFRLEKKPHRYQMEDMPKHMEGSASAGYTFPGKLKKDVMPEMINEAERIHNLWKRDIKSGSFKPHKVRFPPCLAAQRSGMSTVGNWKTRLVWIYPGEMLVIEGRYAFPLYAEYAKRPGEPLLYGNDPDVMVTDWLRKKKSWSRLIGMDISSFDATVQSDLIRFGFDVAFENIDPTDPKIMNDPTVSAIKKEKHKEYEEKKHEIMKQALMHYFINTPILMPDGRRFITTHGVPSGTAFTQLIDSIVNHVYVVWCALMQEVDIAHICVLGDDSGFFTESFSLEQAAHDLLKYFGVTMHPKKCDDSTDPGNFKLLGYKYIGGFRTRPSREWFELALCPEREVKDLCTSFGRLYGMWIAGARHDYNFSRFMEFYQSGYPVPEQVYIPKEVVRMLSRVLGMNIVNWTKVNNDQFLFPP
nr:MAG: RNA-dependent RNA polymerase [Partitiviridae sp.]